MKRVAACLVVALAVVAAFEFSWFQSGQAEDTSGARISALETTVAGQSKSVKSLTRRVAALETAKAGSGEPSSVAQAPGGDTSFSGAGEQVEKVHLTPGLYIVTAHSDGGFFFITVLDSAGNLEDVSVTIADPRHDATGPVTITAEGDYVFDINGTSNWTVSIDPS